jgi:hypothetical protein
MSWKNFPLPYMVSWGTIETGKQSWEVRACWVKFLKVCRYTKRSLLEGPRGNPIWWS